MQGSLCAAQRGRSIVMLGVVVAATAATLDGGRGMAADVSFSKDIAPLLVRSCG